MPIGRDGKKTGCWTNRSRLEQILIGVILTAVVIAVILLIFVLIKPSRAKPVEFSSDICHTPICVDEASKIIQRIDPNANPCEDFYQFACGNFLKASHGDETLNVDHQARSRRKRQLLEMLAEDIRNNEHKMVKSAKKLFIECMNETAIERDNLKTMKTALEEIGGWPVLKRLNWNETKFDWLSATYKLRELGYPFSIILNLDIQEDMENKGRYIFKVESPRLYNSILDKYSKEHAVEIMTEIAVLFGAEDRPFAYKQMDGTYRFWKYLQSYTIVTNTSRIMINDFQKKYGKSFNWLEFISNITGPTLQISQNDYVLFQNEKGLRRWLDLITTTPKRTLANYMIWKVIEEQLPYLTKNLRNLEKYASLESLDETRAEFCLKETHKRFIPSPIEIMYNRKYLPVEKRKQVEQILLNIKSEFVNLLKNANWIEERDKRIAVAEAETITIVVGQPGNYFDDKMLDALDVDMVETKTDTFLSVLAQANRNHQSSLYNQVKISTLEHLLNSPRIMGDFFVYDESSNVVSLPAIATQGYAFQENRPNYLNYGQMGGNAFVGLLDLFLGGYDFGGIQTKQWSNKSRQAAVKMEQCLMKDMEECKLSNHNKSRVLLTMNQGIGETISYAAYENWSKINGEEQKLIGIDYTPRQLFWISATHCSTTNVYSKTNKLDLKNPMFFEDITCGARRNNLNFAKDFNCPKGSKMNPTTKCKLL